MFTNGYAGNFLLSTCLLLSGGSYLRTATFFKFANVGFIDKASFYCIQRRYIFPEIKKYWGSSQDELLRDIGEEEVLVSGDGRNDSPGHCASFCTYTLMDGSHSSAILALSVTEIREEPKRASTNMEAIGFLKSMRELKGKGVALKELVTDAHQVIKSYMKKDEFKDIYHQVDIWHTAKNLTKRLFEAGKTKACADIIPWIPAIRNHFWYCAKTCDGNVEKLKENWTKVLHHVCNVHEWVDPTGLTSGRCAHPALVEDGRDKPWIKPDSPAYRALKEVVFNKFFLQNIKYSTRFRHTGTLESFHNHLLMYCPKRLKYEQPGYEARNLLAAIDYNEHRNRPYACNENGETRQTIRYSKVTKRYNIIPSRTEKDYSYIPTLIGNVFRARQENPVPLRTPLAFEVSDPRKIAPRIALAEKPSIEDLKKSHTSRF